MRLRCDCPLRMHVRTHPPVYWHSVAANVSGCANGRPVVLTTEEKHHCNEYMSPALITRILLDGRIVSGFKEKRLLVGGLHTLNQFVLRQYFHSFKDRRYIHGISIDFGQLDAGRANKPRLEGQLYAWTMQFTTCCRCLVKCARAFLHRPFAAVANRGLSWRSQYVALRA